jgi:purine-binding chemotaxis protein CheW
MPQTINLQQSHIVFQLAGALYGVRSEIVQQIDMVESVTPVPNAPAFVEGVVLCRGHMVPALNLRARFGFDKIPFDLKTRLIVARTGGRTVGLIVDSAREFLTIPPDAIQPPPETLAGLSGTYLKGIATIGDRLILILNVDEILNSVDERLLDPATTSEALS